jgi:DGQHR domain-containing protein
MGSWDYYVVKMSTRELDESVHFAYEVYEDRTLDDAIQRVLNETRVKKEIVTYLQRQPDRFFSSIVVAALQGNPKWYPVEITDDERFQVFRDDQRLNESFGILRFDGTQDYYALDGQHRLSAIKTLLDRDNPLSDDAPKDFDKEEVSVLVVVPKEGESLDHFLQKYRRLFSNLNRYAKPTDQVTNIIMDEDDAFAILTRRLVIEHEFFKSVGRQEASRKIKTTKGKNLRESDPYFTSLETLYSMNKALLLSRERLNSGWDELGQDMAAFQRFRPTDEVLERLYLELALYWDALVTAIPDLNNDPTEMRYHSISPEEESDEKTDHLLFWPIGQDLMADLARDLLDVNLPDPSNPTPQEAVKALRGLGLSQWRLHEAPWRFFLLTWDEGVKRWKMRSEDRTEAIRLSKRIQRWVLGIDDLNEDEVEILRISWQARLVPAQGEAVDQELWGHVVERRRSVQQQLHE